MVVKSKKTQKLLTEAQVQLSISDILLRKQELSMAQEMPWRYDPKNTEIYFLSEPDRVLNVSAKKDKKDVVLKAFGHVFGIKLMDVSQTDSPEELLKIEVEYDAVYRVSDESKLSEEHLKAFAVYNVPHHLWPFCRELVHANLQKMGVKLEPLPVREPHVFVGDE